VTAVHPCPIHGCGALIQPARTVCHDCLMVLPAEERESLRVLTTHHRGTAAHLDAQTTAVAYLNGLGLYRRYA
jgi:hypothetical protein